MTFSRFFPKGGSVHWKITVQIQWRVGEGNNKRLFWKMKKLSAWNWKLKKCIDVFNKINNSTTLESSFFFGFNFNCFPLSYYCYYFIVDLEPRFLLHGHPTPSGGHNSFRGMGLRGQEFLARNWRNVFQDTWPIREENSNSEPIRDKYFITWCELPCWRHLREIFFNQASRAQNRNFFPRV